MRSGNSWRIRRLDIPLFNDGLRLRREAREAGRKYVSDGELSRRLITEAKATPEREWLGEVSAVVL